MDKQHGHKHTGLDIGVGIQLLLAQACGHGRGHSGRHSHSHGHSHRYMVRDIVMATVDTIMGRAQHKPRLAGFVEDSRRRLLRVKEHVCDAG